MGELYSAPVAERWWGSLSHTNTFKEIISSSNDSNEWTMMWSTSTHARLFWSTTEYCGLSKRTEQNVHWIVHRLGSQPYVVRTVVLLLTDRALHWKSGHIESGHPLCYAVVAVSGQKWTEADNRASVREHPMRANREKNAENLRQCTTENTDEGKCARVRARGKK